MCRCARRGQISGAPGSRRRRAVNSPDCEELDRKNRQVRRKPKKHGAVVGVIVVPTVISFKFTWPAAYLSLEQREKRMERLRAKPLLSPLSLGTCVALEQVCSLSCRSPPRPFAARHSKPATRVNVGAAKWKFATHALRSSSKH